MKKNMYTTDPESLKQGFITYSELSRRVGDKIINNNIIGRFFDEAEIQSGSDYDEETDEIKEIFQYYIISDEAAEMLIEQTDELVYYIPGIDVYLWGIDHFGTPWSGVLTDIRATDDLDEVYSDDSDE